MSESIRRRQMISLLAALGAGALGGCEERQPAGQGSIAGAAASAPAAAPAGPPGVTADSIKIGSWGPLSGPAAAWGVVLHSMNAYFAHINASGGIHGRKIQFVYKDDQYNPAKTPGVARELVEKDQVFAIVGGIGTANGRAVADYLEQQGVPFFTPSSGDKFWSSGEKKNVWTVFPRYATEGELLGSYVGKELKKKKVAVLYQDDDFGKQGLEGVKAGLARHGGEVVVEVSCLPTDTDLGGQVSRIVEQKPEVLVLYAAIKQSVDAVKKLAEQKKKPQIVTSFVLSDPILFKLAGGAWDGTISSVVGKLPDSEDESVKLYREVLEKHGGGKLPAGTFTMAGFMFAMPFAEALDRCGKEPTREKLTEAIRGIVDWTEGGPHWKGGGLGPAVSFGKDRRLGVDQIYLAQARGGKWEKLTEWLKPGE